METNFLARFQFLRFCDWFATNPPADIEVTCHISSANHVRFSTPLTLFPIYSRRKIFSRRFPARTLPTLSHYHAVFDEHIDTHVAIQSNVIEKLSRHEENHFVTEMKMSKLFFPSLLGSFNEVAAVLFRLIIEPKTLSRIKSLSILLINCTIVFHFIERFLTIRKWKFELKSRRRKLKASRNFSAHSRSTKLCGTIAK